MATPQKHPKSGIYYFRRAVPKDLRPELGYEIKRSLKTRDPDKGVFESEVLFYFRVN